MHTSPHIITFIHLYSVAVKMHCKVLLCTGPAALRLQENTGNWRSCIRYTCEDVKERHALKTRHTSSRTGTEEASILLHYLTSSFYPAVSLLWRSFSVSGATLGNCQFVEGFLQKATSAIKQENSRNGGTL